MPSIQRPRKAGLLFNLLALATSVALSARAQTPTPETAAAAPAHETIRLDNYVVSATRTAEDPRFVPSAVSSLKPEELSGSQITDLRTALASQPGVIVVSTGAKGSQSNIYMRGAASDQVLLLVDGVRMNSTEAAYANYFGGADLVGVDRLEVLRGPQGTLYGSSAMGGVILLNTTHGCGSPVLAANLEAGSFDTLGASVAVSGGTQNVGYSASFARMRTDNDREHNSYRQTSYSARVEGTPLKGLLVGGTVRGQQGRYEEPGTNGSSKGLAKVPNHLVTTYVQWQPVSGLSSRLTHGWHQMEYNWQDQSSATAKPYYYRNTREIVDWQTTWDASTWLKLMGGVNAEWAHYTNGGVKLTDDLQAVFLSASVRPVAGLVFDIGTRHDKHETAGSATTGRAGASYYLKASGTKFRATYGTGFKAPSMVNRFGSEPWYGPSTDIKPEKSTGWDAGVDQELLGGKLTASATYFHNDFKNLIASFYTVPPGKYIARNVSKAYTEGCELAFTIQPVELIKLKTSYTYLTAIDNGTSNLPVRLVRRPRHSGDVELQLLPDSRWIIGVGVHFVGSREESVYDPATWSSLQVDTENYAVSRAFISYTTADGMTMKLRVENALDEKYAEAYGYVALPRAIYGSIEIRL